MCEKKKKSGMLDFIKCVKWLGACLVQSGAPGEFYYTIVNFLKGCHRTAFANETLPIQLGEND